jgi:hypothetical protein
MFKIVTAFVTLLLAAGFSRPVAAQNHADAAYDFLVHGIHNARIAADLRGPVLMINEQPVPPLAFFYNSSVANRLGFLSPQVSLAASHGVHIFSFPFTGWPWHCAGNADNPANADYAKADSLIELYLRSDPKAVFLLRIPIWPAISLDQCAKVGQDDEILYRDGSRARFSIASDRYFEEVLATTRATDPPL